MYSWAYQYYRGKLDPKQRRVYDLIYRAWFAKKGRVSMPAYLLDTETSSDIVQAVAKDHPEIFWVNYYQYNIWKSPLKAELRFTLYFPIKEINRLETEATAWKRRISSQLPGHFSCSEKAWVLFDYLARQVTYGSQRSSYSHTIIGPMSKHNHVSVCEGIAKSFKFLCDEGGIPCVIVFGYADFGLGQAGPHAWNIIDTEFGRKHIDVTAELELAHMKGKATQTDFLHTDRDMRQYTWDRRHTPVCN